MMLFVDCKWRWQCIVEERTPLIVFHLFSLGDMSVLWASEATSTGLLFFVINYGFALLMLQESFSSKVSTPLSSPRAASQDLLGDIKVNETFLWVEFCCFKDVYANIFHSIDFFLDFYRSQIMSYLCQKCKKIWGPPSSFQNVWKTTLILINWRTQWSTVVYS